MYKVTKDDNNKKIIIVTDDPKQFTPQMALELRKETDIHGYDVEIREEQVTSAKK
jgi:hypothetical protein